MADARRQSSTPAAATAATPATVDPNSSNEWVIGTRVRITTTLDDIYEGEIYTYDSVTHTLSLSLSPAGQPPQEFRILKLQYIKDMTVLSRAIPPPPSTTTSSTSTTTTATTNSTTPTTTSNANHSAPSNSIFSPLTPVSLPGMLEREKVSCRAEHERFLTRGVGVSKDAQEVFDALNRTMQCRWGEGGMIVVVDAMVGVVSPYMTGGDCRRLGGGEEGTAGERALERVKKVLEGERRKMEERKRVLAAGGTAKSPSPTPAQGNGTTVAGRAATPTTVVVGKKGG